MTGYPFPGPRAPENNPSINPQYYQPSVFTISGISTGINTTITTSVNHNYVIGQTVRLLVSPFYGSYQLNESQGQVIDIPSANQVTLNINSTVCNSFIATPSISTTPPQIAAIGDVNSGPLNTSRTNNGTFVPGSFINVSPL